MNYFVCSDVENWVGDKLMSWLLDKIPLQILSWHHEYNYDSTHYQAVRDVICNNYLITAVSFFYASIVSTQCKCYCITFSLYFCHYITVLALISEFVFNYSIPFLYRSKVSCAKLYFSQNAYAWRTKSKSV